MPTDDMKFRFAPHCILSSLTCVMPDGNGGWQTVNDGGDVNVLQDADFRTRCVAIHTSETGEGVYSVVAESELKEVRRFLVNRADKTITLEGFDENIAIDEFRKMAVRSTQNGEIITSFAAPLTAQWHKCREKGAAEDHLGNIREIADLYADSTDRFELHDHHMYNLESSEITDGLSFMDVMAKIQAIGHAQGPTHERFPLNEAFQGWTEVRKLPTYMRAPIRVVFDEFMRELLGDFPDDRVTMVAAEKGVQFSEMLEEAGFEISGMLPPFEGRNILPNYKTGDVAFHRARGVDVVVFSDFMGTYAYAWPTEEGGKIEIPTMNLKFG